MGEVDEQPVPPAYALRAVTITIATSLLALAGLTVQACASGGGTRHLSRIGGNKAPMETPVGSNSVTIKVGDHVGYTERGNKIMGATKCEATSTCRTSTIASDTLKDRLTIPHEFGHLMGLPHTSDEKNLMYYSTDGLKNKTASNEQVGVLLGKAMFRMPSDAKSFETTVEAKPLESK